MPTLLPKAKQELAAQLVASDFLTDAKIAHVVGISRRTLEYWKADIAFRERVDEILAVQRRFCRREFAREIDREFEMHDPYFEQAVAFRRRCERMIEIEIGKREAAASLLQNPEISAAPCMPKVRARPRRTLK